MAKIPEPMHSTVRKIYALHEQRSDRPPRAHLGGSEIGHPCSRYLWLTFRWAEVSAFEGRMLRLFETGVREEARLLNELRELGLTVSDRDEDGKQWAFSACDGHFGASLDGALLGLEEAPKRWHVFEAKTHNTKSFADLKAKGVKASKPQHHAQLQTYMGLSGMERAAYFAVGKDTDEIYFERIHFDKAEFERLIARAQSIIDAAEPPPRLSEDPAWYQCKFCRFHSQCHSDAAPLPNCRTCAHVSVAAEGAWHCTLTEAALDTEFQRLGCESHVYIPRLVERFAELESADGENVVWRNNLTGKTFRQPEYRSSEIRAATDKRLLGEEGVDTFKGVFGPVRIVNTTPFKVTASAPKDLTFADDIPW
jgi:hypothetical protein